MTSLHYAGVNSEKKWLVTTSKALTKLVLVQDRYSAACSRSIFYYINFQELLILFVSLIQ